MKSKDVIDLILLAALWGASFIFMRVASPEFGPFALVELRVGIAGLFLLPILLYRKQVSELTTYWKPLLLVGFIGSALPFVLFAFSTLFLTGGFTSIVNASTPLWGTVIAWLWINESMTKYTAIGLLIGFAGIVVLVWEKLEFSLDDASWAVPASLLATFLYGIAAVYAKIHLNKASALGIATGSQLAAALCLLPIAIWFWPETSISLEAWGATLLLAIASTSLAYILYFRLIANIGPSKAITVTFLIPIFGMLWGSLFLDESVTLQMLAGCGIILLGTALATGFINPKKNA